MTLYMLTTRDEYELPLAIADSPAELAELIGVSPVTVYNGCYQASKGRVKKHSKWHKVEVEDDDTIH